MDTEEINHAEICLIKLVQSTSQMKSTVELKKDPEGVLRCDGRIRGYHPIFLPQRSKLAKLVVERMHLRTLHGGVSTTLTKVRERFWVPKLRSLVKAFVHKCFTCKRYRVRYSSKRHCHGSEQNYWIHSW